MNKKAVLLWAIVLLLLVACGGGETEPATPAANNNTSSSTTTESEDSIPSDSAESEEMEEESTATTDEAEEATEEPAESVAAEEPAEETVEEPAEEAAPASPFGNRPMSGTDPETGLVVNPDGVNPGDTFIVRGEIISMNLTPTTSPEFLIQSPDGLKFRLRSQDLAETFYEDGDQLQPFQYQLGLLAQATATLAADASPSDIPTSADLVLIKNE